MNNSFVALTSGYIHRKSRIGGSCAPVPHLKTKGEKMTKYNYSKDHVKNIIKTLGISETNFCKESGVNRGDLFRFFKGTRPLSELNSQRIYKYAMSKGFYSKEKKSLFKRIVDFIKK